MASISFAASWSFELGGNFPKFVRGSSESILLLEGHPILEPTRSLGGSFGPKNMSIGVYVRLAKPVPCWGDAQKYVRKQPIHTPRPETYLFPSHLLQ